MADVNRVEDLPEWFDLHKYQGCEAFGALEWLIRLTIRENVVINIQKGNVDEAFVQHLKQVRTDPLDETRDKFGPWSYVPSESCIETYKPVRTLVASELMGQSNIDVSSCGNSQADKKAAARWHLIANAHPWTEAHSNAADSPIVLSGLGPQEAPCMAVVVDLNATDAFLKQAFSVWLKKAREEQKEKPARLHYDRWARYGVLPYLDLRIWSLETGYHIPDRVMSAAISQYDAGEANLRKTIAPLADGLMFNLEALQSLAAYENLIKAATGPETL
ncbi:DUF6387 family protein [Stutzerimonas xanthomarina]|uniref:DUF6387 family protein n=1 Tax=Stutzerimonas xanthomarina TaxID=271420 RepID=UPI003AA9B527